MVRESFIRRKAKVLQILNETWTWTSWPSCKSRCSLYSRAMTPLLAPHAVVDQLHGDGFQGLPGYTVPCSPGGEDGAELKYCP